jgi:hypothetical protein
VIAAAVYPTHQDNGLALIAGAQLAAGVGAAKFAEKIQLNGIHIELTHLTASRAATSSRATLSCSPVDIFFKA